MYHANKMFPVKVGWGWYIACLIPGVSQMLSWEIFGLVLRAVLFCSQSCHHSFCILSPALYFKCSSALSTLQVMKTSETCFLLFSWCIGALLAEAMRLPKDWVYFSCDSLQTCTQCAEWLNWGTDTLGACLDRIALALGRSLQNSVSRCNFFLNKKTSEIPYGTSWSVVGSVLLCWGIWHKNAARSSGAWCTVVSSISRLVCVSTPYSSSVQSAAAQILPKLTSLPGQNCFSYPKSLQCLVPAFIAWRFMQAEMNCIAHTAYRISRPCQLWFNVFGRHLQRQSS